MMDPMRMALKNINKNEENSCPLFGLVKILKAFPQNPVILPEIFFLSKFSKTALFPVTLFNPRGIIECMIKIYEKCEDDINLNPTFLKTIVYKYNCNETIKEYVFSNNMTFHADVVTICYLYYIIEVCHANLQLAHDLMLIMKRKYCIMDKTNNISDKTITLDKVIISYPSISLGLLHYHKINFSIQSIDLFGIYFSPWVASVIPVLDSDYKIPLALLLAMSVLSDVDDKPSYVLYQRILMFYNSEVFPICLKLELSKNWSIVRKTESGYKYSLFFTQVHEACKKLISQYKANDPSLEYTLSRI